MRRHLEACGITAQDCVSLTAAQVKSQRKAPRASKAASAGKKRSAGEEPSVCPSQEEGPQRLDDQRRIGQITVQDGVNI